MKKIFKGFILVLLLALVGLCITYIVQPSIFDGWFGFVEEQPGEETPGEDEEPSEEPGTEEPGEDEEPDEEPEIKVLDFTFSDGVLTSYTGSETEIIIPSSYSLEKTLVDTFNNYEELQSYFNNQEEYFYGFPNDYIVTTGLGTEYKLFKGYYLEDYSYSYDYPLTVECVNYIEGDDYAVKGIGASAFISSDIVSVTIPASIEVITHDAFLGCENLTSVIFEDNSKLTEIGANAFSDCSSLTNIILPTSLIHIDVYAFIRSGLESISIPQSVTEIGMYAFNSNKNLKIVILNNETPPELGNYVFGSCNSELTIYVPESAVEAYKTAEGWSQYADIIYADTELSIGDEETPGDDDIVEIG